MKIKKFHKMLARRYPMVAPDPENLNRDLIKQLMQCHLNNKLKKLDDKTLVRKLRRGKRNDGGKRVLTEKYIRRLIAVMNMMEFGKERLTNEQKHYVFQRYKDQFIKKHNVNYLGNCREIESNRLNEKINDMKANPALYRPTFNY